MAVQLPLLRGSQPARRSFPSRLHRWGILIAILTVGWLIWAKFEWFRPLAELREPVTSIGESTRILLDLSDSGSGLRSVEVTLDSGNTRHYVLSEEYPAIDWRGSRLYHKSFELPIPAREFNLPEGNAVLTVHATDWSWLNLIFTRGPLLRQNVEVDYTPPSVEVMTGQHYLRHGGSEMVVYKVSDDAAESSVEVGHYSFPGVPDLFPDDALRVAMFAVPQDLSPDVRPRVVAQDRTGNRRGVEFWASIRPRRFRDRTIAISDNFLQRTIPNLLTKNGYPPADDLVGGYLTVNRDLRVRSETRIRKACQTSAPKPLWEGAFLRQPNAASSAAFADRRTYTHGGKVIDHQTHLGYDLASLRLSPVPAANHGRVVFAETLGIYGEAVILDHGLGVFSLYGHMSSIAVHEGEGVRRGDTLGRTGETGLAGGDHLHFSMMLYGQHVDPLEWWDPKWIHDHITEKLEAFGAKAKVAKAAEG